MHGETLKIDSVCLTAPTFRLYPTNCMCEQFVLQ